MATERLATWMTPGSSSPEILCMLGIMSIKPCEEENVALSRPPVRVPCSAPAAPASDYTMSAVHAQTPTSISVITTFCPNTFFSPLFAQLSQCSPMPEEGVMGNNMAASVT